MEMRTDHRRNLPMGFPVLMALPSILVNPVTAANDNLNLPSTIVRMEVSNGTVSYFETTLSEVPLGYM